VYVVAVLHSLKWLQQCTNLLVLLDGPSAGVALAITNPFTDAFVAPLVKAL
jgi:hypothetical protein